MVRPFLPILTGRAVGLVAAICHNMVKISAVKAAAGPVNRAGTPLLNMTWSETPVAPEWPAPEQDHPGLPQGHPSLLGSRNPRNPCRGLRSNGAEAVAGQTYRPHANVLCHASAAKLGDRLDDLPGRHRFLKAEDPQVDLPPRPGHPDAPLLWEYLPEASR